MAAMPIDLGIRTFARSGGALVAAVLAISAAACSGGSSSQTSGRSAAAPTSSVPDNNAEICEGVHDFAIARADRNNQAVAAWLELTTHPEKYPPQKRIEIRIAFETQEASEVQALAAKTTDPQLRTALQNYADGWAELAADRSTPDPKVVQPDWLPVMDLCRGLLKRVFADLDAMGA
jgi:hypothetical protein